MGNTETAFVPDRYLQADSLCLQVPSPESVKGSDDLCNERQKFPTEPLTDESREIAIIRAGKLVEFFQAEREAAQARYEAESFIVDCAAATAARMRAVEAARLMEALIRGRNPGRVARMEQERGLA